MALSIGEFIAPIKTSTIQNRILALMYYVTVHEDGDVFTGDDIRNLMKRARDPKWKTNIPDALSKLVPKIELVGRENGKNLWRLTDSGKQAVRKILNLPEEALEAQNEVASLTAIANKIDDKVVREYLLEGIECLRFNALRAAIVFLWSGTMRIIHEKILTKPLADVNNSLRSHRQNAREIKGLQDFSYVKDSEALQVAMDLGIIDKAEKGILGQCLDLRNDCGHPTKYIPRVNKVKSFVEDIIGIVFS